jgi:thioredoxin-related protein
VQSYYRWILQGVVCSLLSLSLAQAAQVQGWDYLSQSALKWRSLDAKTIALAQKNKKLLMVLVYKDDCAWCQKYETESIETDEVLKRLRTDYLPVAVDAGKQPLLAKKLGAFVVPTTLLLTPKTEKIVKFHGFVNERDLTDILDANLFRWRSGIMNAKEFGDTTTCCPLESAAPKSRSVKN